MSTLRSNKSKSINPILKYFTDLKNSDKSASIKHSHISLRPLLVLLMFKRKNRDFRFFQKLVFFWLKKNAMTTLRSNNSKSINPIFKYFTDLKNSDKSALINHSHSSLRPLLLLLIIVCKNCILSCGSISSVSRRCYFSSYADYCHVSILVRPTAEPHHLSVEHAAVRPMLSYSIAQ